MNTALRERLLREIGDMPEHGNRMFRGHRVERFITGFWVDSRGPMRLEEAVSTVLVTVNEPLPQGFPCDI